MNIKETNRRNLSDARIKNQPTSQFLRKFDGQLSKRTFSNLQLQYGLPLFSRLDWVYEQTSHHTWFKTTDGKKFQPFKSSTILV